MRFLPLTIGVLFLFTGCDKKHPRLIGVSTTPAKNISILLAGQSNMARAMHSPIFLNEIRAKLPDYNIYFSLCAVGGTSIAEWQPGLSLENACESDTLPYPLGAILFYQGESDAMVYNPNWPISFMNLVHHWQNKYGDIPIVFAQINDNTLPPGTYPDWRNFQQLQTTIFLSNKLDRISAIGLPLLPNNVHLEDSAFGPLADRFAGSLVHLL
jgi:hypothetical protein